MKTKIKFNLAFALCGMFLIPIGEAGRGFSQTKGISTSNLLYSQPKPNDVHGIVKGGGLKVLINFSEFGQGYTTKHQTSLERSLIPIFDSIYYYTWNTQNYIGSIGWNSIPLYKDINFVYDAHNNQISYLKQVWDTGIWKNIYKYTYTYDVNNNVISCFRRFWNNGTWVSSSKRTSAYDANNNMINDFLEYWYNGAWEGCYLHTFTFDANNNQTNYIEELLNTGASENSNKYTYTYDANNNLTSNMWQILHSGAWDNVTKKNYSYDANNNLSSNLEQSWGYGWENFLHSFYYHDVNNNWTGESRTRWNGNSWDNFYQSSVTYDSNNKETSKLTQNWNNGNWVNDTLYAYTYDANNNTTIDLQKTWGGNSWKNRKQFTYTYDANNIENAYTKKAWDVYGNASGDSILYYYHTVTGINDLHPLDEIVTVFPNPFNLQTTILFNEEQINTSIKLMDVLGKEIKSIHFTGKQLIIEKGELNAGIYFVQIVDGKKIAVNKKIHYCPLKLVFYILPIATLC